MSWSVWDYFGGGAEDDEPHYEEPEDELCSQCCRATIGEGCNECGRDLCPMCFSAGGGFCSKCPTENYQPYVPEGVGD